MNTFITPTHLPNRQQRIQQLIQSYPLRSLCAHEKNKRLLVKFIHGEISYFTLLHSLNHTPSLSV